MSKKIVYKSSSKKYRPTTEKFGLIIQEELRWVYRHLHISEINMKNYEQFVTMDCCKTSNKFLNKGVTFILK